MPTIGEVVPASKGRHARVYHACLRCGKERWVNLRKGLPLNTLCRPCGLNKKIEAVCILCGQIFKRSPSCFGMSKGKYCSRSCSNKAKVLHQLGSDNPCWRGGKVTSLCEECGRSFSRFPSKMKAGIGKFCSQSCRTVYQRKHTPNLRPNLPEQSLIALLQDHALPFRYVGNGEVWLGNRNPDFINTNGRKQVIELFGTYWHPIFDVARKVEHYKQYGFSVLIVWEDELKTPDLLLPKLRKFAKCR